MKEKIAKSDWLTYERCSVKAWFEFRRETSLSLDEAERFRMEQGQEIGKRAQELYPNGIFVAKGADQTPKAGKIRGRENQGRIFTFHFVGLRQSNSDPSDLCRRTRKASGGKLGV